MSGEPLLPRGTATATEGVPYKAMYHEAVAQRDEAVVQRDAAEEAHRRVQCEFWGMKRSHDALAARVLELGEENKRLREIKDALATSAGNAVGKLANETARADALAAEAVNQTNIAKSKSLTCDAWAADYTKLRLDRDEWKRKAEEATSDAIASKAAEDHWKENCLRSQAREKAASPLGPLRSAVEQFRCPCGSVTVVEEVRR